MSEQVIIGKIPGYNINIDHEKEFEKELMKGLTFIDLYPTSYTDSLDLINKLRDSTSGGDGNAGFFGKKLELLFKSPGLVKSNPSATTGEATTGDPSYDLFKSVLQRMQESFNFESDSTFAKAESIRIVAANDSTFTETFTNSFGEENMIVSGYETAKNIAGRIPIVSQFLKGAKSFDSMTMQNIVGGMFDITSQQTGRSGFAELATGAMLGMNIAAPQMWSASQYNSTLTLFIKLISPTGQPECIRKNILEPLLYLIAASSPITAYGMVYGYPLMWQVHAHGITNFRIGSIAALSIIRGSFETTFTTALQPTVIDVRLTIIPLLNDFAVQTKTGAPSIYDEERADFLGVQNPADTYRGTMNTGPVGGRGKDNPAPKITTIHI